MTGKVDPDFERRVFATFESLLAMQQETQEMELARLRGKDPALHEQLVKLLAADAAAGLNTGNLHAAVRVATPDLAGTMIDRYRLLEQVGSGGMGVVYRAQRVDAVDQQVAVKLVRQELRGEPSLARFRLERQTLARLEHPGIARLIDAGVSADGRPWYVMEFVDGEPIDDYCNARDLDIRQRVALLVELCRIVEAAHRMLIVHRDLKPGNVLVTRDGHLKLIDFGIAKFIAEESGAEGLTVAMGAGFTPHFAAPEQVEGQAITTATDVFGIGALAFFLLTGRKLFAGQSRSDADYIRLVTTGEFEWPSRVAASAQLRGDLDNILRKALSHDPGARYASAGDLGRDLENYLQHRPVLARAPSLAYRTGKLLRRNRAASVLAGLLLAASAVGLTAYVKAAGEVRLQRDKARIDARRATEVSQFLEQMLSAANPRAASEPVSLTSVVDNALQHTEEKLSADPLVAASVLETIASVNASLGRFDQALDANQRALDIHRKAGDDPLKVTTLLADRGELLQRDGRFEEAGPLLEEASASVERQAPHGEQAALIKAKLGAQVMNSGGDYGRARQLLEEAVRSLRDLGITDERLAGVENDLGVALAGENRFEEAIAAHKEAVRISEEALGPDHMLTIDVRSGLAGALGMAGRFGEGAEVHRAVWMARRKVLGDNNLDTLWSEASLADYLNSAGSAAEAVPLARAAYDGLLALNGPDHPVTQFAEVVAALATCRAADPRWGLARARDVYRRRVATYGEAHWLAANTASVLGECELANGQYRPAEKTLLAAASGLETARGADFVRTQETYTRLVDLYTRWHKPAAARIWLARLSRAP